ncbi:zincin-like metallopeptidase domain-containing protein, partial [Xanthomonas phaseoli]
MAVAGERGFTDTRWLTYKQAQEQGAQVRRGEHGTVIQFWKWHGQEPVRDAAGNVVAGADGKPRMEDVRYERPRVFSAAVFNAQQVDGLPAPTQRLTMTEPERHERAEALLDAAALPIHHDQDNRAFYRPATDSIHLPAREQFRSADGYYATALHEVGHATGHESRLGRDLSHPFGSQGYAREELRAEIASLMLGQELEIGHDPGQHAAYVSSWIEVLENDPREIFRAASDAEKIVQHVLGLEQVRERAQQQDQATSQETAMQAPRREAAPALAELGPAQIEDVRAFLDNPSIRVAVAREGGAYVGPIVAIAADTGDVYQQVGYNSVVVHPGAVLSAGVLQQLDGRLGARDELPADPRHWAAVNYVGREPTVDDAGREDVTGKLEAWQARAERDAAKAAARQEQAAAADPAKPVHQRAADRPAQSPRTYLAVPYADKDQAKAAGAKWDRTQKAWYAPEGADMAAFAHWAPSREPAVQASPEAEFGQALQRAGLVIDGAPIMDGKMHRVPAQGDTAGEKSGAYVGYLDGHPAGYIQNFKSDIKENWKYSGRSEELTATDRARLEAEAAEKLATRQAERDQRYREVSQAVGAEYAAAVAAASDHPYLREKGVGAHDLKVDANGKLLLSMRDVDGTLWSVQRIDVDGTKSFEKDGRKAGTFHLIGDLEAAGKNGKPQPIGIAEGYATAATVHEATGVPVAVAFDAYNLSAVAAEIAAKFPDRPVVIFGDDDRHRADEGKVNVGRDRALEAAREIGAQAVFPQFAEGQKGSQYSDFNDLAKAQGKS